MSAIENTETLKHELTTEVDSLKHEMEETVHKEASPVTQILNDLGDHEEFSYGIWHADILPVILYDKGQFHFYGNRSSMEDSGDYVMVHHHIVRASNHEAPDLNLSITNMVAFQWMAMILLLVLFFTASKKAKKSGEKAPSGIHNLLESIVVFIRDDVVQPNIAGNAGVRLLPYFLVLFMFILVLNLIGLLPGGHTATGTIGVTAALAITAFFVINYTAIKESGIKAWFHHLLGGAPWWLGILMIPIEIASMFIKPFSLTIRLFANMVAGHTVLFSLMGLLFLFQSYFVAVPIVGFATFINLLELLVAFLQAYIFTMLTAIFVGLAIGEHSHEHAH
ncbi:MAG: ATP synthase F0 subunit A [Ignavibacteriae bacterium HGW-Ignavibacteriae-4]|jgi:F-type H+-transporting ATPase subunit a|nr:MAG: ATP synthase F0 subunit A [Ignavibacteriae bacterium HGW-Ignavibacteriae-4]